MRINEYILSRKQMTDEALLEYIPPPDRYPALLHRALHYSVFPGGKRFRAVLTIAAYETFSENPAHVLPAACSAELIHTYSLVHDDMPCLDNDDFRRGKPSVHRKFGEAAALLAGATETRRTLPWRPPWIPLKEVRRRREGPAAGRARRRCGCAGDQGSRRSLGSRRLPKTSLV